MDTWMGVNHDPQTLHKYMYTHADPVNNTDPTGNYTLSGLSTALNIRGILTVANRTHAGMSWMDTIISADPGDDDLNDKIPTAWDYLMSYVIRALGTSMDSGGALEGGGMAVTAAALTGGKDKHHTIPVYCCGHKRQEMSLVSKADHKMLHAQLYGFTTAVNVAGTTLSLAFNKRKRGSKTAPLQRVARTSVGRGAIVQALTTFYVRAGYASKGTPSIGSVLSREGRKFINGHHSVKRNCKR